MVCKPILAHYLFHKILIRPYDSSRAHTPWLDFPVKKKTSCVQQLYGTTLEFKNNCLVIDFILFKRWNLKGLNLILRIVRKYHVLQNHTISQIWRGSPRIFMRKYMRYHRQIFNAPIVNASVPTTKTPGLHMSTKNIKLYVESAYERNNLQEEYEFWFIFFMHLICHSKTICSRKQTNCGQGKICLAIRNYF